jgi:Tfp pilus assembly protein PilX
MLIGSKKILGSQSGVALVIALLMMVVLTLVGLASVFTSSFEMRLSGNKRGATDAFYSSDSGIQFAISDINHFNLGNVYPLTPAEEDPAHPKNITGAAVSITHNTDQHGSPRGSGMSATNFEFEHFMINSTGEDQIELNPIRSTTTLEEKVVRLVPTLQGGY